jgi:hypothetical protein
LRAVLIFALLAGSATALIARTYLPILALGTLLGALVGVAYEFLA